jgi:FKBP-type peptidyl-prolyl cis-trans isomerase FklB
MKRSFAAVFGVFFLFGLCFAEEKPELKDQRDKESYSLGYQFGESLKLQNVDINLDVYLSGIRDALGGQERRMSDQEIKSSVSALVQRVNTAQQKTLREQAIKNFADGKAFLEENGKKEGVKTLPSGLQYKIVSEGTGKTPHKTDTVMVRYRGTLINGEEFDKVCAECEPMALKVDGVIAGWSEALLLMKEGAKWQLFIPPDLAYGVQGSPPRIMPNSALIFDVELVSIK